MKEPAEHFHRRSGEPGGGAAGIRFNITRKVLPAHNHHQPVEIEEGETCEVGSFDLVSRALQNRRNSSR